MSGSDKINLKNRITYRPWGPVKVVEPGQHPFDVPSDDRRGLFLTCECVTTFCILEDDGWCFADYVINIGTDIKTNLVSKFTPIDRHLFCKLRGEGVKFASGVVG
jgi:hypothetical protein